MKAALLCLNTRRICPAMISLFIRAPLFLPVMLAVCAPPALAAPEKAATSSREHAQGPKELGKYDDWTGATYQQGGQMVCYAFTRAKSTQPGGTAGTAPILTVTERAGSRDEVAITSPFTYPKDASVTVQVNQTGVDFYTAGRDAFARDGKAAAAAFARGEQAVARGPGPHDTKLVDTYSLKGFAAAHDAIVKACPAR